jgi:hypothetical protein
MTGRGRMPRRKSGLVPGSLIRRHGGDHTRPRDPAAARARLRSRRSSGCAARRRRQDVWAEIIVMGGRYSPRTCGWSRNPTDGRTTDATGTNGPDADTSA